VKTWVHELCNLVLLGHHVIKSGTENGPFSGPLLKVGRTEFTVPPCHIGSAAPERHINYNTDIHHKVLPDICLCS